MQWIEVIKDLTAGTIGGVAGIITGHPLDTIKVRLQTQVTPKNVGVIANMVQCSTRIFKHEGSRGFYKGMLSPIVSNAPINAVIFGAYGQVSRYLQDQSGLSYLRPIDHLIAGSFAGLLQTVFSAPAELVKITLQVDSKAKKTSSTQCAKRLLKKYGLARGLYRGWSITAVRDIPAIGIYFYSYDVIKSYMSGGLRSNETNFTLLVSGGFAGSLSWLLLQPIDVVKTLKQSLHPEDNQAIASIVRKNFERDGPAFFMKGYAATLLRSFPVNAVTFLVYEKCMEYFGEKKEFFEALDDAIR